MKPGWHDFWGRDHGTDLNAPAQVAQLETLESLALATQYRDPEVAKHNQRVGYLAALIAQKLGMPEREVELIRHAAPLHDIGTLFIPESLLFKPAKLLPEEFEVIKTHVDIGAKMLWHSQNDLLRMAHLIVQTHHERFDGSGYPKGLKGASIPLIGQVVAVADVFDTLVHDQPYRPAWSSSQAIAEVKAQAGKMFDPLVIRAFSQVMSSQRWVKPPAEKGKTLIRGRLGAVSLFDMILSLEQNGQTCKFHLYTGYSHALLLFDKGRLVHAEVDELRGEAALTKIAQKTTERSDAKFTVEAWRGAPAEVTLKGPTQQLLLSIAVTLDEKRVHVG